MVESSAPPSLSVVPLEEELTAMLSAPQFTVAAYLNLALKEAAAQQKSPSKDLAEDALQQRMAELALQLQLQTQSCHEDIGRIGAELQAILPRCAADVGRVGVGLEGMRFDAQTLLEATSMGSNEEELGSSMETLSTLHALQVNLSRTKEILKAAATWDSTLESIPPLLAQQKLTEAVQALAVLESGERALRGMPDPESRRKQIAEIRQQVQVLLQPQLKHALQNMNTRLGPLQQCVALYSKLDKMDSLREEYIKTRPSNVHKAWFAFSPSYNRETGESVSTENQEGSFISWLPGWYETVLTLLGEEKRQSVAIFGVESSAEVVAKVLQETFRPILASFRSRLETLYPSNAAVPSKNSLDSICQLYESTLGFMALCYEAIVGSFFDAVEAGVVKGGDNGLALYQDLLNIFYQISSPFKNYIENFDQLESKYSAAGNQKVSKELRNVVSAFSSVTSADASVLQLVAEGLQNAAPSIFTTADASLDRSELMRSGYTSAQSLTIVDKCLSNHLSELVISMNSLSAAVTAPTSAFAEAFEEQHVPIALDTLKMVGLLQRATRSFEGKTREKLGVWAERLGSHLALARTVAEAVTGNKKAFSMPDALSMTEISSVVIAHILGMEDEDEANGSMSLLQRLSYSDNDPVALFPETNAAFERLVQSCHMFVYNICAAVPRKHITGIPEMSCWYASESTGELEAYGTLPQQYITQVGEHMLALVQALEPFAADSNALDVANEVLGNLRDVASQAWSDLLAASGIGGTDKVLSTIMDAEAIAPYVLSSSTLSKDDDVIDETLSESDRRSAEFCNQWLDAVGLAISGQLLERIMRIPKLSPKGCEHLAADLDYLVNVFSALGLAGHPHPMISHVASVAALSKEELSENIEQRDRSDPIAGAVRSMEAKLALLRGISTA